MRRAIARSFLLGVAFFSLASAARARELSFEDRVAAEEEIQRVSYVHQVGTTRPFEEAVPRTLLEGRVRTFLERAGALEQYWHTRIDEDALRREWRRIERETVYPDRLREIYRALGNDPVLIAECFVRPVLTLRLTDNFFDEDERIQRDARARAERLRVELDAGVASPKGVGTPDVLELTREEYDGLRPRLDSIEEDSRGFTVRALIGDGTDGARVAEYLVAKPSWRDWWTERAQGLGLEARAVDPIWHSEGASALTEVLTPRDAGSCPADDTWNNGPFEDIPDSIAQHAAVWTGTEMLIWSGVDQGLGPYKAGWHYDPAIDTWDRITTIGSPSARIMPTAVWSGSEMIVWGGKDVPWTNSGGRYDPNTHTWLPTSTSNAPVARMRHTVVWTGTRMIVWGGASQSVPFLGDGASYDPATDTWTTLSSVNAPSPRESHSAVWTGTEMIIWGGLGPSSTKLNDGARYDPATDTWTPLTTTGAPVARAYHSAIWTGTQMIVFGGTDQFNIKLQTGSRWSEATGWSATSTTNAPEPRGLHTAVWTGSRMLIWGGGGGGSYGNGRAYDPATNQWGPNFSSTNSPSSRLNHSGIWTGDRLVIWGGQENSTTPTYTGGRYDPSTDTWTPTSTGEGAAASVGQHAGYPVWTGTEFMFLSYAGPGWAYNPLTNTERIIPASGRPAGSTGVWFNPVWTGDRWVLWGDPEGAPCCSLPGHGLLYNPIGDQWTAMSTFEAPWGRAGHSVVWTGSQLIVWAGSGGSNSLADGQRYDMATDTWLADIPTDNAPLNRTNHCAFWDGDEMIVYGGSGLQGDKSGGRYNLATDSWSPMAAGPISGQASSCIWTGTELFVLNPNGGTAAARYDPANDTWSTVPTAPSGVVPAPGARLWTGTHLFFWGGLFQGGDGGFYTNAGLRFDTQSNTWQSTSQLGAPSPRTPAFRATADGIVLLAGGGTQYSRRDGGRYVINLDRDGDAIPELCDNCPGLGNAGQDDADADNLGDACDTCTDLDGDTLGDPGFPVNTCGLDNCPSNANPTQTDFDVDGAGDACDSCTDTDGDAFGNPGFPANTCAADNCPSAPNPSQADFDVDGAGDACDSCTDTDGDAFGNPGFPGNACANDNCPSTPNASQADFDVDGAGDACDSCTDTDHDTFGNPGFPGNACASDNCVSVFNTAQRDTDADGLGDLCDVCPNNVNPGQADADGDGAGDACDCQAGDPNDRAPGAVSSMTASKPAAGTIALTWSAVTGADAYSITRGDLDSVATGVYGSCLAQGVASTSYSDATVPASGSGFAYLVQAQSYDCGLGSLGRDSTEAERTNGAGACAGNAHTDSDATGESAVFGTTTGALSNVTASDNLVQTITEELTGGSPSTRVSRLEHRWTFSVGAGSFKQLHVEGFRSTSTDGDNFRFEYSTDGVNFTAVTLASLPFADNGIDLVGALPAGLTGTVTIRVVDTDRTPGNQAVDSVSLDELFVRAAP
jgi:N-acetylneuraminic acid mutarotase